MLHFWIVRLHQSRDIQFYCSDHVTTFPDVRRNEVVNQKRVIIDCIILCCHDNNVSILGETTQDLIVRELTEKRLTEINQLLETISTEYQ